jgi:hypothetical protein
MPEELDQITHLFNTGASVETIAEGMGLTTEAVRRVLFEKSPRYRRETTQAQATGVPLDDEMMNIIVDVARNSENDLIRLSAAKYARDDIKGRRDAVPQDDQHQSAMLKFLNERMNKISERQQAFFQLPEAQVTNG